MSRALELQIHASCQAVEIGPDSIQAARLESLLGSELAEVPASQTKPLLSGSRGAKHLQKAVSESYKIRKARAGLSLGHALVGPPAIDRSAVDFDRAGNGLSRNAEISFESPDEWAAIEDFIRSHDPAARQTVAKRGRHRAAPFLSLS